jgi:Site-specific recombinase XerD
MATIKRIENKKGISYKITVSMGRDQNDQQLRHTMTWKPERQMTERQLEKAVNEAAIAFEKGIRDGFAPDNRQTLSEYAQYVIDLKESSGACKHSTIVGYRFLMRRIDETIGNMRLVNIRPHHINTFYTDLLKHDVMTQRASARPLLRETIKKQKVTQAKLATLTGLSVNTIASAGKGNPIALSSAAAISSALGTECEKLFRMIDPGRKISRKTVLEYHRLLHAVLAQAEREMIVTYNAAAKATPPAAPKSEANHFQATDIQRIRSALDAEPLKWNVLVNLLIITGCRRGEIMGLKWAKVDFKNSQVKIDNNLIYKADIGVYEDTTKTGSTRFIKLPAETMALLKQYRRWWLELKLKNGDRWVDADFLFVQDNGKPMVPDSVTRWLARFSERHDLPHINPHAFRHTMASILIDAGTNIVAVSKRLGHGKVSTTTDIYSHVLKEADERASESLADVMLRSG